MTIKLYCPAVASLGDFFNIMPVISGLSKVNNDQVRLVVNPALRQFKGFREFMDFQRCIDECVFRDEIIMMEEASYITLHYSEEEFINQPRGPRPFETMRHEKFIRDNYPQFEWEVDDKFLFRYVLDVFANESLWSAKNKYIVADRWSQIVDKRRGWDTLKSSGLFDDPDKYYFLDFENQDLLTNVSLIANSQKPLITCLTAPSVIADLLYKDAIVLYDDEMTTWDNKTIQYLEWKHFYFDRNIKLVHLKDFKCQQF